jgi:hypothetical protein
LDLPPGLFDDGGELLAKVQKITASYGKVLMSTGP